MNWHYEKNGVRHDNVTDADITERIQRGELNASTLVWQQGMTEWQPLSATSLADILKQNTVPPRTPRQSYPRWRGLDAGLCSSDWVCPGDVDGRTERNGI
ncbi:membrane protein [Salmonella enterica]|uniref:Membrane protein n=1 Tax=Salmonella enterica TaxID=28901 RepID=A0A7D8IQR3_SALER|nr:membrane protein [Salmonella enterica]